MFLSVPTYSMPKGLKKTGFHITDFCNSLHEPTQNPMLLDLDLFSSFILFYEFLYFPLKVKHAMQSVAILNKVMLVWSILEV